MQNNSYASYNAKDITFREQQIIHLIAKEYSTKEIAEALFINFETVKSHRKNLFVKFNVKNVAGLVRVAFEKKILNA